MTNTVSLSLNQIQETFERDGYVKLEQLIAPDELKALQEDSQVIIEGGYKNKANESDYFYSVEPNTQVEVFHRVQYIFPKAIKHNSFMALLAHPYILEIVQHLLGADFISVGEALVFKMPGNGQEVPVHSDCNAADPRLAPDHLFFNVDFYLDDSRPENGCLLVAPGSHKLGLSRKEISEAGFDYPGLIEVPMRAGDVLLHNTRLVHGSHKSLAPTLRRTLYYEFHSLSRIVQKGVRPEWPVNQQWVHDRLRQMMHAIDVRKAKTYTQNETPFPYQPPAGYEVSWPLPGETINYRTAMGHAKYF